jgi:hypothetical protein
MNKAIIHEDQKEEQQNIEVILAQCYQLAIARNQALKCNGHDNREGDKCQKSYHNGNDSEKCELHSDRFGLKSALRTNPWPKTG